MADSSLMHTGESPPQLRKGHTTADLGPTDSTDSGSDVVGGPGFSGAERGALADADSDDVSRGGDVQGAGPDLGDPDLDSDSDRSGTGEVAAAGPDTPGPVDQTLFDGEGNAVNGEDISDDSTDTTLQERDAAGARSDEGDGSDRPQERGARRGGDVERDDAPSGRAERNPAV